MLKKTLLLCAALFTLVVTAAPAAGSTFNWGLSSNVQIDQPVEQQTPWIADGGDGQAWWPNDTSLWVTNPTGCAWDVDDHWQLFADGALAAGVPVTYQFCSIVETTSIWTTIYGNQNWWSFPKRLAGVSVRTRSPDLTVEVCLSDCVQVPRYPDGRGYEYRGCLIRALPVGGPSIIEVPGSNGGLGAVTQGTFRVTATKKTSATSIAVVSGGFGDWSVYC